MIDLEGFTNRIESFYNDVRTEVLVAELLNEGLSPDTITILHGGQHKRSYRRDLDEAYIEVNKNNQNHLVFKLNRDSIYDSLPESLFHHIAMPQQGSTVKNMVGSYRKRKEEEKQARAFFAPIENEFFFQRAFIELMEQEFLEGLNKNNFDDYFLNFFNIPSGLPADFVKKFAVLLPYCDKIIGNLSITFKSLELILGENVKFEIKDSVIEDIDNACRLSESILGVDLILGTSFFPDESSLTVTIGPIKKENLNDFLEDSPGSKFIQTFYDFFLPASLDIETIFEVRDDALSFTLGSHEENSRLGFTTQLDLVAAS
ncbi:MAG TPA: type VI secretion system baseplate subunit TssG [Cytophagaceae bacterium]|jgi:hypothetical protein